jgi:hypothetical protein
MCIFLFRKSAVSMEVSTVRGSLFINVSNDQPNATGGPSFFRALSEIRMLIALQDGPFQTY